LRRVTKSIAFVGASALALGSIGLGAAVLSATAAFAAVNQGTATISVSGTNLSSALSFDLNAPNGAACSSGGGNGTSYRSFLVPYNGSTPPDLTALTISSPTAGVIGVVDQGAGMANASGFIPSASPSTTPPGQIDSTFADSITIADLLTGAGESIGPGTQPPAGTNLVGPGQTSSTYAAGIVCFDKNGAETDEWSIPIQFTLSGNDAGGNGIVWTPNPGGGPQLPEAPLAVGLPIAGATLLAGVIFVTRRRRTRTAEAA
jgi:hypothetical protein